MKKVQKNELLSFVRSNGYVPADFELEEIVHNGRVITTVRYKNSPFYFYFSRSERTYSCFDICYTEMEPGWPTFEQSELTFATACEWFDSWLEGALREYSEELAAPDLWAEYASRVVPVLESRGGLEHFSESEQAVIAAQLNTFRLRMITEYVNTDQARELVDQRMEYLEAALPRLNRFDWKSVLVSSIVTIVVALSLNQDTGKAILEMAREVFTELFRLLD